jgi:hypothetical protein
LLALVVLYLLAPSICWLPVVALVAELIQVVVAVPVVTELAH